ncbi:DUF3634 family protein [Vibrio sp. RC27]
MIIIIVIGILLVVAFFMFNRSLFKLDFKQGKLEKQSGNIPAGFLNDVKDISARSNVTGSIKVVKHKGSHRLIFSNQIPDNIQQRIRNIYPYSNPTGPNNSNKRKG